MDTSRSLPSPLSRGLTPSLMDILTQDLIPYDITDEEQKVDKYLPRYVVTRYLDDEGNVERWYFQLWKSASARFNEERVKLGDKGGFRVGSGKKFANHQRVVGPDSRVLLSVKPYVGAG